MRYLLAILIALAALAQTAEAVTITYTRTDFPSGRPPERVMAPRSTDADTYEEVFSTGNALNVFNAGRGAGERNPSSTTGTDYASVSRECDPQDAINLATDASTTYTGPIILCGYSLTVTVGTEAATIDDNTTAKVDLPVSWPIGNYPNLDLLFRTSLVVNPGTNSTGTLRVWTRPGDAGVTR